MTKTKIAFLGLFTLVIAACGGRSSMHITNADDGGAVGEAGAKDGKRDVVSDGASNVPNPDLPIADDVPSNPDTPGTGQPDARPADTADAAINRDVRGIDVGTTFETTRLDGGPVGDGRATDGRNPGDGLAPPTEVGRGDTVARPDQAINPPDGRVRPDGNVTFPDAPPVTLTGIEISPASPITVNVGTPRTITVTAIYSDNSTQDVSGAATVTSANTSILTVAGVTLTGLGTTVASTTITATYQGQTATATVNVNGKNPLVSISIDKVPTTAIAIGQMVPLVATGVFTDGTRQDVTAQATWASSAASVATVGDAATTKGQVVGVATGTFTVTATVGSIVGTSTTMTVSDKHLVSIAITPSNPTLQRGLNNQAFIATGTYSDNSTGDVTLQATWSSSNTGVLTVVATGANAGRVSTVAAGTATVTATVGSIPGTTLVTVTNPALRSITISGSDVLIVGSPLNYKATGTFADNTTADLTTTVTWSSSNAQIFTVSNAAGSQGLASGVAAGSATLRAAFGNVTGQLSVTVSAAPLISITVAPKSIASLIVGLSSQLKATGLYGDPNNVNTQFSIDVTTLATWKAANSSIATVDSSTGLVTGVSGGDTTITATLSGQSDQATVHVVNATLLSLVVNPSTASVRVGQTYRFQAVGTFDNQTTADITNAVTWSSSNEATATISNAAGSNGLATGVAASTTAVTITATMGTKTNTASLTVSEARIVLIQISPSATQTINTGANRAYTVAGIYENGTTTNALTGVTWSSSDTSVATIAANGGRGGGPGGAGATATGVGAGSTTIKASYTTTDGTVLTDSVTLNVQLPAHVIAIRINPSTSTIMVGDTQAYTVDADYSDGTTTPVTAGVTLTASNGTVASVGGGGRGGGGGGGGLTVTGQAAGTATITASYTSGGSTFTDTSALTVNLAPTVTKVYIDPLSASVTVGGTQQFRAFTQNSDGTSTDVTANASTSWTTSDGTLATITTAGAAGRGAIGAPGGGGLATGVAVGNNIVITATYTPAGGTPLSATATLNVVQLTPQSLVISPPSAAMLVSGTQAFTATLIYTNGSSITVTDQASWTTSDANVVVMSNAATGGRGGGPGGPGIVGGATATALGTGSATVTATYTPTGSSTALTATASVTVTDPPILSLEISPTNPTVYLSSPNQQFIATVIFTDYSMRTVTNSTQWTSSKPDVAVISSSGGTIGRATARSAGTTTITASYTGNGGTFTASTTLTVDSSRTLTAVQVTPTNPTTHLGVNQAFVATAVYDSGPSATVTGAATWTSSDGTVAGVGTSGASAGVATPSKGGKTTITATYNGVSGTSLLTVDSGTLSSITITPAPLTVAVGGVQQLTATGNYTSGPAQDLTNVVTWTSSADGVATVSVATGSRGLLTAVSTGLVSISAVFQGVTGTLSVNVGTSGGSTADAAAN